jgi:hypothetical protein
MKPKPHGDPGAHNAHRRAPTLPVAASLEHLVLVISGAYNTSINDVKVQRRVEVRMDRVCVPRYHIQLGTDGPKRPGAKLPPKWIRERSVSFPGAVHSFAASYDGPSAASGSRSHGAVAGKRWSISNSGYLSISSAPNNDTAHPLISTSRRRYPIKLFLIDI